MVRTLDAILIKGDQAIQLGAALELDRYSGPILEATGITTGEIIDIWVNKAPEGTRLSVPASVAADGNTFEIGVRGRNTGNLTFIGGMEVTVQDPDGITRASPAVDWTGISPREELTWTYNICPVDKPGTWTTLIRFLYQE